MKSAFGAKGQGTGSLVASGPQLGFCSASLHIQQPGAGVIVAVQSVVAPQRGQMKLSVASLSPSKNTGGRPLSFRRAAPAALKSFSRRGLRGKRRVYDGGELQSDTPDKGRKDLVMPPL